jgi:hypothetical protein
MRLPTFAVLVFIAAVPFGYGAEPTAIKGLPADVTTFKDRRDLCDHFHGEEPYNAERRMYLEESMNKYCTGTDKALASLKGKYRDNTVVLKVLSKYEEAIEPND